MSYAIRKESKPNPMAEVVRKATLDPDWFAAEVLKTPNDPWQSELMNAVADLDRIRLGIPTLHNHLGLTRFSIRSCHGTGKTHLMAKLMHWFNFTRRGRIPCTAPKERQLITRLWPEFRKIRRAAIKEYSALIKVDKTQISWCGDDDWCALIEAASVSENLAGYHDDHLMFLVDEASGVDEQMFPAIEGALSTENAILVMIGNPTRTEGEFWASHRKPGTMEQYYKIHVKPEDSPHVSNEWVEKMRKKYGKDSPVYVVRCLGEFAEMTKNQLIALAWIEDAKNTPYSADGSICKKRISVDVGDGSDETIITVAFHYASFIHFRKQYRFSFPSSESPILAAMEADRIAQEIGFRNENDDDIVVDSLGVGAGTAGELIRLGYNVITYKGGEASDDSKQWRNRRSQSYISLRDFFRDKKIRFSESFFDDPDDWEDFQAQLCSIKSRPGIERVEEIEPKNLLKESPDMADSAAMQMATQVPVIGGGESFAPETFGTSIMGDYDGGLI